ncbi:MAG: sulfite exporter TauE/SafE family protein [Hyphomicrobium sp.]
MHSVVELIQTLLPLLLVMFAGGLSAGFLAGLLGVGGGAILVPILYEAFSFVGVDESIRMHMVLGTSFAVIAPTSFRSAYGHWKKKAIDRDLLSRLGPWVTGGALFGVVIAGQIHTQKLIWIWVIGSCLMALKMGIGNRDFRLGETMPKGKGLEIVASFIGVLSALLSIGGGMFFVSLLSLYSVPMIVSLATSAGFGPLIAFPCMLAYMLAGIGVEHLPPYSLGYVNPLAAALIIPTSLIAVPWGVNLAHKLSQRRLEVLFAVYLFIVCLNFLRKVL